MKRCLLTFVLLFLPAWAMLHAQAVFETEIPLMAGESWYGGIAGAGDEMPFSASGKEYDLALQSTNNQVVPLLLSNKGRYIWSEKPFRFEIRDNSLVVRSFYGIVEPVFAGQTLHEAYTATCAKYFPPSGKLPDAFLFSQPQYQINSEHAMSQDDIISYAEKIITAGLPPGTLILDDNWHKAYGTLEFMPGRFTDPQKMIAKLHEMGFRVMLWVSPMVSPDSPEYRRLAESGYLLKRKDSDIPAIIQWWNGQSACLDMTNPQAKSNFVVQLKSLQNDYGIDGFMFAGGDISLYRQTQSRGNQNDTPEVDYVESWISIGLEFPMNGYVSCWKMGAQPLVQNLGTLDGSWKTLASLVPQMTAAGLMGYTYACPAMTNGGLKAAATDDGQRLLVRWAQIQAMMPMMQFSADMWQTLSADNLKIIKNMVGLHAKMLPYISELAKNAAQTGEPIIRHMEYAFPGEEFADCTDQFMLGNKYMVAPVVDGEDHRDVKLPKGRWRDDSGQIFRGGTSISINAPLDRLPYFERI